MENFSIPVAVCVGASGFEEDSFVLHINIRQHKDIEVIGLSHYFA